MGLQKDTLCALCAKAEKIAHPAVKKACELHTDSETLKTATQNRTNVSGRSNR